MKEIPEGYNQIGNAYVPKIGHSVNQGSLQAEVGPLYTAPEVGNLDMQETSITLALIGATAFAYAYARQVSRTRARDVDDTLAAYLVPTAFAGATIAYLINALANN